MDAYEVIKIGEGSWRIENTMVRTFLFTGDDRALLIDSGLGSGDLRAVVEGLTDLPVTLVNTHADGDHTGCNRQFDAAHMHPAEFAYYFENADKDAPVCAVWNGDTFDLGGRVLEVIHLPGHTPGSIALLDRAARILVTGDNFASVPVFMFGSMRSVQAYIASLEKLKGYLPHFDTVYPSHGSFPLPPSVVEEFLAGARLLAAGALSGEKPEFDVPAQVYKSGSTAFFYD